MAGVSRGFGLYEALVALTLLAVGLLAVAGLVRSVAKQMEWGRVTGEAALVGQQVLEEAMADTLAGPAPADTISIGNRGYAVRRTIDPIGPRLVRIQALVTVTGAPGVDLQPSPVMYSTYQASGSPRPLPP